MAVYILSKGLWVQNEGQLLFSKGTLLQPIGEAVELP